MMKLRINPLVADDLRNIYEYINKDNEEYAGKTINDIYGKFEYLQTFPEMGAKLSKRVSFKTDYRYITYDNYIIIYKIRDGYVEIYRVLNRYQDITRLFSDE